MNIYAVRDRLIDYYMQPFVGPNEKEVMAALARTVNNTEDTNGIAQAPHHFELWELGKVDEEGNLTPTRRLVCDCASLIRVGVRRGGEREGQEAANAARPDPQEHRGNGSPGRAQAGPVPGPPQAKETTTGEVRRRTPGGYYGGMRDTYEGDHKPAGSNS